MLKSVVYFLISVFPLLRFNRAKVLLYNLIGYRLSSSVVISSSAKIMGDIKLSIGEGSFIGHETMIIGGRSSITIGSLVDISSRVSILSGTHEVDMVNVRTASTGIGLDVVIEDGVWIGFGAIIMPGVKIGYKSIIGGGSVVTKDIPAYSVAVGNPCKVIRVYDPACNIWHNIASL